MSSLNAITWNELKLKLEDFVKRELRLSPNSKIDIKLSRPAVKGSGEINIQFSGVATSTTKSPPAMTVAHGSVSTGNDDEIFILSALRDAYEKNKFTFIGLQWFKTSWLPKLGAQFSAEELHELITRMVAEGKIVVEKVNNPFGHPVSAIRTPDMPESRGNIIAE